MCCKLQVLHLVTSYGLWARLASFPPTADILYSTAQIHAACDYDTENFIREVNFQVSNIKVTRMHRHTIFCKFTENNNLPAKRSPSNSTGTSSKVPPESICKIKAQNQVIQKLQVQLATTKPPTKKTKRNTTQLQATKQKHTGIERKLQAKNKE